MSGLRLRRALGHERGLSRALALKTPPASVPKLAALHDCSITPRSEPLAAEKTKT